MTVLVTGATGNVGSQLMHELADRDVPARAFVRDPDKARRMLGSAADLAVGTFEDAASLRRAMNGVDTVFLSTGDHPGKVDDEVAVIDAAVAEGVPFLVKLSVNGAAVGSPVGIWRRHALAEEHLMRSGLPSTVLAANFFMTNLFAAADHVQQAGRMFAPAAGARIAMIDPADVAATAAVVLTDPQHREERYVLTGSEPVQYPDVARYLTGITGRPVDFVDIPDDAARGAMRESGLPDWYADDLVAMFGELRRGIADTPTDTVQRLTGRQPATVEQFLTRTAAVFGAVPALSQVR
jgi:uncharacterized protein YbjT (DUF2867 family)